MLHTVGVIFCLALFLQVGWIVLSSIWEAVSPKAALAGQRAREAGEPVIQKFGTWLVAAALAYFFFHFVGLSR